MTHPHPTEFYIAHRLFTFGRNGQTVTEWGSLTDGPADRADVLEAIREDRGVAQLSLQTLRVYHFQADVPARDVTEDVLADAYAVEDAA